MELLSPELVVRLKSQNGKQNVFAACLIPDDWVNYQLIDSVLFKCFHNSRTTCPCLVVRLQL